MASKYEKMFEKDYQELLEKYDKKSEEYKQLKYEYQLLKARYNTKERQLQIKIELVQSNEKEKYDKIISSREFSKINVTLFN